MISMSDMKYDAIVNSGIKINKRFDLPEELIPPDSQVVRPDLASPRRSLPSWLPANVAIIFKRDQEIAAKIGAGYFAGNRIVTEESVKATVGRSWEDLEH